MSKAFYSPLTLFLVLFMLKIIKYTEKEKRLFIGELIAQIIFLYRFF
jgi:hypothetical protein